MRLVRHFEAGNVLCGSPEDVCRFTHVGRILDWIEMNGPRLRESDESGALLAISKLQIENHADGDNERTPSMQIDRLTQLDSGADLGGLSKRRHSVDVGACLAPISAVEPAVRL